MSRSGVGDAHDEAGTALADLMATVAATFHQPVPLAELLGTIVRAAQETIPGAEQAGISLTHAHGRIETVAATDPVVERIDAVQYGLREGPCVDAVRSRRQSWSNHLGQDVRWPRFGPQAEVLGVRSQMGVALFDEPDVVGVLNLYSSRAGAFDDQTPAVAAIFATHAAHALGRTLRLDQLNEALASRRAIGIAIGLLMERYQLNEQRAFEFLVRTSQTGNVKLRDLAEQLLAEADRRARPRG
ncbi:GAF and ANTAR domain-containing protein [Microlunatus capsulatus]|uniref:GAF domain-containing protein n=1 Tax=Microlunatus capsulatus TaxID=99117 RepID=A0ABS4Z7Q2_9ACTN|nr:GAF and ANTAR domain-containing protein [Microlunatus capsulatus]MBP2416805.1 GAF domain-containing protein [Microlunatus capsulatus]